MTSKYSLDLSQDEAEAVKNALYDWIAIKDSEDIGEDYRQTFVEPLKRVDERLTRSLDPSNDKQEDIRPNRRFR
jgi:hypothetical protein